MWNLLTHSVLIWACFAPGSKPKFPFLEMFQLSWEIVLHLLNFYWKESLKSNQWESNPRLLFHGVCALLLCCSPAQLSWLNSGNCCSSRDHGLRQGHRDRLGDDQSGRDLDHRDGRSRTQHDHGRISDQGNWHQRSEFQETSLARLGQS